MQTRRYSFDTKQTLLLRLVILQIIFLNIGCKSIIVKPTSLFVKNIHSLNALNLYPNNLYESTHAMHDVGGVIVILGTYDYKGDTLVLTANSDSYLQELMSPLVNTCDTEQVRVHFREYPRPHEDDCTLRQFFGKLKLKGLTTQRDTLTIWSFQTHSSDYDLHPLHFNKQQLEGISHIWLEIFDEQALGTIELPVGYECLDITFPLLNRHSLYDNLPESGFEQNNESRFIVRNKGQRYQMNLIEPNRIWHMKKSDAIMHQE